MAYTAPSFYRAAEVAAQEHLREMLAHLRESHRQEVQALRERVEQLAEALAGAEAAQAASASSPGAARAEATSSATAACKGPFHESDAEDSGAEFALTKAPDQDPPLAAASSTDSAQPAQWSFSTACDPPCELADRDQLQKRQDKVQKSHSMLNRIRCTVTRAATASRFKKAEDIRLEHEQLQTPAQRRVARARLRRSNAFSPGTTRAVRMVEHPVFDSICALMIIVNSVLIGWDVEWRTTHDHAELWLQLCSHVCNIFFFVELLIRVRAYGRKRFFLRSENFIWNWFDTLLVGVSIFEFLSDLITGTSGTRNIGSSVKAVKMLRIARIFRVFRFFKELSILALMIMDSMRSLCWALAMLSIILYVFSVIFTQLATDYVKESSEFQAASESVSQVRLYFGGLARTLYTLLQSMLGGINWGVASDTLMDIHWTAMCFFFFYIFFTMLAFLNITTGVFVDNAVETARTQRDFLVQKEADLKERYLSEMRDLFCEMDEDRSGSVTMKEVMSYFGDPRVQSYFAALGLDIADTERLFSLLDVDNRGAVNIQEFLAGCLRLKGMARSIDVQQLLLELQKLSKRIDAMASPDSMFHRYALAASGEEGGGRWAPGVATGARAEEEEEEEPDLLTARPVPGVIVSRTSFSI